MRELTHTDQSAVMPVQLRDAWTLPWQRRERADANIRRAIGDLRALSLEDTVFSRYYHALAETLEGCVRVLDLIEDADA